ncbi:MAG: DoxX family protein [Pseudomonadota bacterium]
MHTLLALYRTTTRFDVLLTRWGGSLMSLTIRCYIGWQFMKAGLVKVQDWSATLALFRDEYHVPLLAPEVAAYLGAGAELVLPVLLFAGLLTRPAALALFLVNALAVLSYPQLFGFECPAALNDHFFWGAALLVVAAFGPGRVSLDYLLQKNAD